MALALWLTSSRAACTAATRSACEPGLVSRQATPRFSTAASVAERRAFANSQVFITVMFETARAFGLAPVVAINVRNTDVAFLLGRKRILGAVGFTLKNSRIENVVNAVAAYVGVAAKQLPVAASAPTVSVAAR